MNLKEIILELLIVFEQKLHITISNHTLIKKLCSKLPAIEFDLSSTVTVLEVFCELLDHEINQKFTRGQKVTVTDIADELSLLVRKHRVKACPKLKKVEDAAVLMFLAFIGGCATVHKGTELIRVTVYGMMLHANPTE